MESKNSVVSWNFSAMPKKVSPLSTPTTVSHCGVDCLAVVQIAKTQIGKYVSVLYSMLDIQLSIR